MWEIKTLESIMQEKKALKQGGGSNILTVHLIVPYHSILKTILQGWCLHFMDEVHRDQEYSYYYFIKV